MSKVVGYTERKIAIREVACEECSELTCKSDGYELETVLCLNCLLKKRTDSSGEN